MRPTHPAAPAQPVPRKGGLKAGTLIKVLVGLVLMVCAGLLADRRHDRQPIRLHDAAARAQKPRRKVLHA